MSEILAPPRPGRLGRLDCRLVPPRTPHTQTDGDARTPPRDEADSPTSRLPIRDAMKAADACREDLLREVVCLDEEHAGSGAPAAAVRRVLFRSLADLCSVLAPHLSQLQPDAVTHVLDRLFASPPFNDRRMSLWSPRLRDHVAEYVDSLDRWESWVPVTLDLDAESLAGDVVVRRVTAWMRPDDGAVAADFVGYFREPRDFSCPDPAFAAFLRDADDTYQALEDEYGEDRVKGIRLWIVGSDRLPVKRWLVRPQD